MKDNSVSSEDVFNLFSDLNNLPYYLERDSLKSFYLNCLDFIDNGKMNINQQNEDGDTLLHLAFYYSSKDLINKLLNLGADTSILNKKNMNCFQNAKEYGFSYRFFEDIKKKFFFNKDFPQKVSNFHPNFKMILSVELLERTVFHDTNSFNDTISILEKAEIYSINNFLSVIEKTVFIDEKPKFEFIEFLNTNSKIENNSQLLYIFAKNKMDFYNNIIFELVPENNEYFKKLLNLVFSDKKHKLEKMLYFILPKIIEYKYDIYSFPDIPKKYLIICEKFLFEKDLKIKEQDKLKFKI